MNGLPVTILRPNDQPDAVTDEAEIEAAVLSWRDALNTHLEPHVEAFAQMDRGHASPYFTDKPAWDGFSALLVWAAHEEHRDVPPASGGAGRLEHGQCGPAQPADGFKSRYGQLLHGPELWLPGEFSFTCRASDVNGNPVTIGAVGALLTQLRDLPNDRTWRMTPAMLAESRRLGAELGAPLERSARFAFAVFHDLAQSGGQHHLPMKLDY